MGAMGVSFGSSVKVGLHVMGVDPFALRDIAGRTPDRVSVFDNIFARFDVTTGIFMPVVQIHCYVVEFID